MDASQDSVCSSSLFPAENQLVIFPEADLGFPGDATGFPLELLLLEPSGSLPL